MDAVYGCHISSWLDEPIIAVNPGPRSASTDEFSIEIQGEGCHGVCPTREKTPWSPPARLSRTFRPIVSRQTDPIDTLVITVGKLESGTNYNVVADTASMSGTVRTYSQEVREGVEEKMRQVAENVSKALGCTATVNYIMKTGPVIHSDPLMCKLAHDAVVKLFGEQSAVATRPVGGGD